MVKEDVDIMHEVGAKEDHMQVEVPVEVVYMQVAGDQTEVEEHEKEDKYENGKE